MSDRAALTGILYVLHTGIPWEYLPQDMGYGCGMTCWRRLRDRQKAGVWQRLHESVLHKLRQYIQIEWERASIDSASIPSPWAGITPAAIPRTGESSAASTIVNHRGVPLGALLSAADVHDSLLQSLVLSLPRSLV